MKKNSLTLLCVFCVIACETAPESPPEITSNSAYEIKMSEADLGRNNFNTIIDPAPENIKATDYGDSFIIFPADESELFDINGQHSNLDALMEMNANVDNLAEFDKESGGKYLQNKEKLQACQNIPIGKVWSEFSPFFNYQWNDSFVNFAALFLTFWKRESLFAMPNNGVLVQPHCRTMPPRIVKSLRGKDLKADIEASKKKDAKLSKFYKGCSMRMADFGSLQWNFKWRISKKAFRPTMEKSLLLASDYTKKQVKKMSSKDLSAVVKYNSKSLFILGGLEIRKQTNDYKRAIREYNTNPEYWVKAEKNYADFLSLLQTDESCSIQPKKTKKSK